MDRKRVSDKFLLVSRIDYPGEGFRKALLELMKHVAIEESVDSVIVLGGLVSYRELRIQLQQAINAALQDQREQKAIQAQRPRDAREDVATQAQIRAEVRETFFAQVVRDLSEFIPVITGKHGKPLKIHVTLSPAHNYDGPWGPEIVQRLHRIRTDITLWDHESARFELKKDKGKVFWGLNPEKPSWRGDYYSTSAQRLVNDKTKQTPQELPVVWAVGTGGSAINRPAGGNAPRPYITVPALHRIQRVNTSENQIGVCVIEIFADSSFPIVRTYNFKDLVSREREFIPISEGASEMQKAILAVVIRSLPTIGMLEDMLPWTRNTIEHEIKRYNEQGFDPPIHYNEHSGRYDVSHEWLARRLQYPLPSCATMKEDSFLGFGCFHAGYKTTQYEWFARHVPELILQYNIRALVDAGDNIAGLKHNLHLRGEIFNGINYTKQEGLAGEAIGAVISTVFEKRFDALLAKEGTLATNVSLTSAVEEALLAFYDWRGNHDEWVQEFGVEPLEKFHDTLFSYIALRIHRHLVRRGFALGEVDDIVARHLHYGKEHVLPSGLTLSIRHPHQGRMVTESGRAQQTLGATLGKVVFLANFHTKIAVHDWRSQGKQRFAMQLGTLVSGTDFEDNINKLVDTGVGMARIFSDPDTHDIFMTEVIWDSPSPEEIVTLNDEVMSLKQLKEKAKII